MSIPTRFLDEIRNRLTLSDVIGQRVQVTRAGREFKACCPFHKEKTPSFTINDDKQFYHCFGCGAHGDVIGFVMQHDNLDFIAAVEVLSAQAGLQMPKPDPESAQKAQKDKGLTELMDEAALWLSEQLYTPENEVVLNYLRQRGMKEEVLRNFRVGYAPHDSQKLRQFLKGQGYSDAQIIEAGMFKPSTRGGEPYGFFRERVMFPVGDRRGRVVAFGGRILPDHIRPPSQDNFKPPKYLNSSDTPIFDKSTILYGQSQARQALREGHTLVVTEGYMDVIACHQAGFKGAVAPMGTALTEEQIMALWSMIPEEEKAPVLCFDGDSAGQKAAVRACERVLPLLKPNHSVRFAFMPEGEDPDSLIQSGGTVALQKVLGAALNLFDFLWVSHTAGREFKTPEARAGLVKKLKDDVFKIADRSVQSHYMEILNARVSETFFPRRQNRNTPGGQSIPRPGAIRPRKPLLQDKYAKALLAGLINHPHIFESVEEEAQAIELHSERFDLLRQNLTEALIRDAALDSAALCNHLMESGFEKEMGDILSESVYVHAAFVAPQAEPAAVCEKWLSLYDAIHGQGLKKEIQTGWRKAFDSANEDEEKRLKSLIAGQVSGE